MYVWECVYKLSSTPTKKFLVIVISWHRIISGNIANCYSSLVSILYMHECIYI